PAVNQVEMHPYFGQAELRAFHAEHGIQTQAWSPLGRNSDMIKNPVIAGIADKHNATPAEVILAWHLARNTMPLPASANPQRQHNNLYFDVELDTEDLVALDCLEQGRIYPSPDVYEEF